MELAYVPGSARLSSNAGVVTLSDDIVTTGALIGSSAADGVAAGPEDSAWITLGVKVNMPRFSVQTSGRVLGEGPDKWRASAIASSPFMLSLVIRPPMSPIACTTLKSMNARLGVAVNGFQVSIAITGRAVIEFP